MIELAWGVLWEQFIIAGDVTLLHLQSIGNGIVAGHRVSSLGAECIGVGLLHREALQDEQGDVE